MTNDSGVPVVPDGSEDFDASDASDATIVVHTDHDATVAVPRTAVASNPATATHIDVDLGEDPEADPDLTVDTRPVKPALPAAFFKSPLDPRRRARESPFAPSAEALPRRGVAQGMPIVYGARAPGFVNAVGVGDTVAPFKTPPAGEFVPEADRSTVPSIARQNERFRILAYGGGAVVALIVVGGLVTIGLYFS